jgi:hypothetical protein
MTTPAILAYVREPSGSFTGSGTVAVPDFTNNLVNIGFLGASHPADGFAKFNGYTADTDLLEQTLSAWTPLVQFQNAFSLSAVTYNGYIVFQSNVGVTNELAAVRQSDYSLTAYSHVNSLYSIAPLCANNINYVIAASQVTTGAHSTIYYAPIPSLTAVTSLFTVDERQAVCCRGAVAATGTAFVIAAPAATTGSFGLYKLTSVSGAAPTNSKLGTVSPAQIDATWTHITDFCGLAYDQSDGNVLCFFQTTDAVTTKNYLVKLSATDASVLWTLAVNVIPISSGNSMSRSNITAAHTFYYLGSSNLLYTVNTSAGTATTATIGTLTPWAIKFQMTLARLCCFAERGRKLQRRQLTLAPIWAMVAITLSRLSAGCGTSRRARLFRPYLHRPRRRSPSSA